MDFFKHVTDAHEGRSMQSLMRQFGIEGYAAYFILMEICAKKIKKKMDEQFTEDHFKCVLSERLVREKLRMRSTKVELFLNSCATLDLLLFTKVGDELHFQIPKLLECMDRDSKRARTERDIDAPKREDRREKIEDRREKKEESFQEVDSQHSLAPVTSIKKAKPNTEANRRAWDSYCEAYMNRYGVEPIKNKRTNFAIADFVKRVGEKEAPDILHFYVYHNDSFYLKALHQLNLAVRDAEALRTQWVKGKAITTADVRKFEKQQGAQSTLDKLRAGEI